MLRTITVLAIVLLTVAGCQNATGASTTSAADTTDALVGTWTLTNYVNGQTPYTAGPSDQTGTFTASASAFSWTLSSGGGSSSASGSWTKASGTYTLTTSNKAVWTATITDGKLTIVNSSTKGDATYLSYTYAK